jgi:hypothetical protein
MSSDEEPKLKYSYRFRVEAKQPEVFDNETEKAEVQSYINELLGLKGRLGDKLASSTF